MKMNRIKAIALAAVLCVTGCSSAQTSYVSEESSSAQPSPASGVTPESTADTLESTSTADTPETKESPAASEAGTSAKPTPEEIPAVTTADSTAATTTATTTPTTAATAATTAEYGPTDIGGTGADEEEYFADDDGFIYAEAGGELSDFEISFDKAFTEDEASIGLVPAPIGGSDEGLIPLPIEPEYPIEDFIQPEAGLLTGGEWNDNSHWSDWQALYSSHSDWSEYKAAWRIEHSERIAVKVTANGAPIEGVKVSCASAVNSAVTDNKGMAYLFYTAINGPTEPVVAEYRDGTTAQADGIIGSGEVSIDLGEVGANDGEKLLDFMIMCDTTGSMSDELEYLKEELKDIIRRVQQDNANIPTRLSVNFYRDEGDEYIVREYPFTSDIDAACEAVSEQRAMGGGDFPEAVHTALDSALNDHDWSEDSVKIMFLVLDAPPHEDVQIVDSVNSLVQQAAEMGVRIIPIASSGIDKSTEYLLRTMAFTTGGTYTFLTNDSGIGGDHIEATVGAYNVEKLNDMMVRIVNSYLA
ncbi:MAG: vWA domain-containing protein [Oscillospiraceae bacterium]